MKTDGKMEESLSKGKDFFFLFKLCCNVTIFLGKI